ncbi:glycosyltransferase family 9 protein [Candidatus Omnitrophota bacterium]
MKNNPLPDKIDKILLVQLAGIGDLVMATPAIKAIRQHFPEAQIALLTSARAKGLLENSQDLDSIYSLDYGGRLSPGLFFSRSNWSTIRDLRNQKFDLAVNLLQLFSLSGAFRVWLLLKAAGVGFTAGRNTQGRGFFFDLRSAESDKRDDHEVASNLRLARAIGAEADSDALFLETERKDLDFIAGFLSERNIGAKDLLVGINPGSAWRLTRRWRPGRFAEVADALVDKYGAKIIITGSLKDKGPCEKIASFMKSEPVISAGLLTIPQLVALIKRCGLYISTDAGPMHIAAAVGTPLVAVFGPAPSRYFPYGDAENFRVIKKDVRCSPCYRRRCSDMRCMEEISTDEVLRAAQSLLKKNG